MYLTVKQHLKHLTKYEYNILRDLSRTAKNLANESIYHIRQHYFTNKEYLRYEQVYGLLKDSPNYKKLNSNMAQQVLKEVDGSFKSFFGLLNLAKKGKYNYKDCKLPRYLPKDGYATLVIGFVRINGNKLILPYSNAYRKSHSPLEIKIPPMLVGKRIKEIRIIPKFESRFFEIQYVYEAECIQRKLHKHKALGLDLGVNNLITAATNDGKSFIIDGRKLKAVNQWFNKENARLQSIKDKQGLKRNTTNRQKMLAYKRNKQVNDYMSKAAKLIITYCIQNEIGTLVLGYNETFQQKAHMGRKNNQSFVNIPFGKLYSKLKYLCEMNGVTFVSQEESYTSRASFWDKDDIPVYSANDPQTYSFSGNRMKRGLYKTKNGKRFNADVNGALNILRKSKVVNLRVLYNRGEVETPVRIRIA